MKNKYILIIVLFLTQPTMAGVIKIKVVDSLDLPLVSASAALIEKGSSVAVSGALANEEGEIVFEGIDLGEYEIILKYLGKHDLRISSIMAESEMKQGFETIKLPDNRLGYSIIERQYKILGREIIRKRCKAFKPNGRNIRQELEIFIELNSQFLKQLGYYAYYDKNRKCMVIAKK